jgi:uncharacterized protein (TIGR02246 family)
MVLKQTNNENKMNVHKIAEINFQKWNEAIQTHNPKQVAELYAENCTFLPTVSNQFKKGQAGAEEYFIHFLEKRPVGKIVVQEVQMISDFCYLHSGMYNFEVGPVDNRDIVEARFSYIWQRIENEHWLIIHHHSSLKPQLH